MKKIIRNSCLSLCIFALALGLAVIARAQTPAPAAPAAAAPAPAPAGPSAADAELATAAGKAPTTADLAKGDPGGTLTGTISDVPAADSKAGVTLPDVANQVGQNKIAANFIWTLVTGFLVMFMQAGFAMVESGLCRVKNANHTYMMNFFVYTCGLFAYWLLGFSIQMGGAAGNGNLGGLQPLASEHAITLFGKTWGLFGQTGYLLSGHTYDVGVMVIFLFEMVFMDTALTIVTGACAERWKFAAFSVSSVVMGAITYPLYGNWAWGGGWLAQLGSNLGLGKGYCDFAGSGVVHAVGGLTALAVSFIVGPRIGKFNKDGSSNPIIGHDISAVLIGCFILAFGWFGFNPGSTLGASAAGNLRIGTIAVDTMLAGCTGTLGAILYMWAFKGKPDASMSGNGLLAGLVAITAPSGFVSTAGAAIIGFVAGVSGLLELRVRRKLHEGRRSSRRHLCPWDQRPLGRALDRAVCRRDQQLRRKLEWRHRLGHRPVLRRRRQPACRATGRHLHADRLRVHAQLRHQPRHRVLHRTASFGGNRVGWSRSS